MIRTPAKPTPTAAQRRGPTRSPSSGTDSAVTASGVSARTACTSASGSRPKHQTTSPISSTSSSERSTCSHGRAERRRAAACRAGARTSQHQRDGEHVAQPDDLRRRVARAEELAGGVHQPEHQHGREREQDAAQLGARRAGRPRRRRQGSGSPGTAAAARQPGRPARRPAPTRSSSASANGRATSWRPIGMPLRVEADRQAQRRQAQVVERADQGAQAVGDRDEAGVAAGVGLGDAAASPPGSRRQREHVGVGENLGAEPLQQRRPRGERAQRSRRRRSRSRAPSAPRSAGCSGRGRAAPARGGTPRTRPASPAGAAR